MVLGGSTVGLELGQAYLRLGARVILIELLTLLPRGDAAIGAALEETLEGEGMRILTRTNVESVSFDGARFRLDIGSATIAGDRLLVATGRRPNTRALGLENAGVESDAAGAVKIDDHMRTTAEHVYGAGDCTSQPHLVFAAAAAGTRAAINMTGGDAALDLATVPAVAFTARRRRRSDSPKRRRESGATTPRAAPLRSTTCRGRSPTSIPGASSSSSPNETAAGFWAPKRWRPRRARSSKWRRWPYVGA